MDINASSQPLKLFNEWMIEAKANPAIKEANAMALATIDREGELHNRVVLCKYWSEDGFTFFTNYDSRKGKDLADHPKASAVFYWDPLFRQFKISGTVEKTSRKISEDYWRSRPRDSQISQWISRQSQPIASRDLLQKAWMDAEKQFAGTDIPCPEHWGGYLIRPKRIEFWIGRPGRLHERFEFEKTGSTWTFRILYP